VFMCTCASTHKERGGRKNGEGGGERRGGEGWRERGRTRAHAGETNGGRDREERQGVRRESSCDRKRERMRVCACRALTESKVRGRKEKMIKNKRAREKEGRRERMCA